MKEKVDEIISTGIKRQASDIHFVPSAEHIYLKMRIEGVIERISTLDHMTYEKILAYLKFVSQLNVSERKTSQSGMLQVTYDDTLYHIRISTLPQSVGSEATVLRLLKAEFSAKPLIDNELLFQMMKLSHGLILMTGPTGSGKSTLMYYLLAYARDKLQKQIITIEDPVEQILHETIQVSVNEKAGITYQSSFKAILRCDPDIIMIGEIRDDETAKQVINAALSGHLVLSTLHANNCAGAIERLLEMGNNSSEIKQAVQLITNQRLIRMSTGRELVLEMFNQQQVEEYFSNQAVNHYTSIAEQLETLYHSRQITLSELEKHRVVN